MLQTSSDFHRDTEKTLAMLDIRLATPRDIDTVTDLYHLFFAESTLPDIGLEFDPARMRNWVSNSICGGRVPHVCAFDEARAVGVLSYWIDHSFTTKPFASMEKFYVSRDWRISATGRLLLSLALECAKGDGAVAFRAGISSGIGYGKNLFFKLGFAETPGSVLLERKL